MDEADDRIDITTWGGQLIVSVGDYTPIERQLIAETEQLRRQTIALREAITALLKDHNTLVASVAEIAQVVRATVELTADNLEELNGKMGHLKHLLPPE